MFLLTASIFQGTMLRQSAGCDLDLLRLAGLPKEPRVPACHDVQLSSGAMHCKLLPCTDRHLIYIYVCIYIYIYISLSLSLCLSVPICVCGCQCLSVCMSAFQVLDFPEIISDHSDSFSPAIYQPKKNPKLLQRNPTDS